ncbi:transposase [Streptomyces sp. NPDC005728]|uniref:transposase n=1 Tax=Streptomyces sp. NPDC005728 TaxID=3157054 RepID=UPI0033D3661C
MRLLARYCNVTVRCRLLIRRRDFSGQSITGPLYLISRSTRNPNQRNRKRRYAVQTVTSMRACKPFGLRRSRYRGLVKTTLQHQLTGAAINLIRVNAWLTVAAPTVPRFRRRLRSASRQ